LKAIILEARSGFFKVKLESGEIVDATARKKIMGAAKRDSPIIPGDNVIIQTHENGDASIEEVLDRTVLIQRGSEKRRGHQHAIVANVDHALIVFAADKPRCRIQQIDRYIVAAEYQHLDVTLVFNKWDLSNEHSEELVEIYSAAGYDCIQCEALNKSQDVKRQIENIKFEKLYIMGPSGVGKSSIINTIFPDKMVTGSVNQNTGKGRHTTTHVELLVMDDHRYIVDTPGMGQLVNLGVEAANLKNFYREFVELAEICKYRTCMHLEEPGCEIKENIGEKIDEKRYQSYVNFVSDLLIEDEKQQQKTSKKRW
jgi:ribosome biogenesis GTPase / thiamine phosphate phosphatase